MNETLSYANHDSIKVISLSHDKITTWVDGSRKKPYKVTLSREKGGYLDVVLVLTFGEFSYFCKHMVAVGLFHIHHPPYIKQNHSSVSPLDHMRTYLTDLSADSFREIILTQAEKNNHFFDALLLKAEFSTISSFDATKIRHLIAPMRKLSQSHRQRGF